jgi:PTHB1 N-terminus
LIFYFFSNFSTSEFSNNSNVGRHDNRNIKNKQNVAKQKHFAARRKTFKWSFEAERIKTSFKLAVNNSRKMSLFKILPWFNYQSPDSDQNYDSFSMTCARLSTDNEQQKDNIIITSHSGMIAILQPSICDTDNLEEQQQYHSSIVYEAKLNEPVLGVLCGSFIQ